MTGVKESKGKTRWSLLPFDALESVVKVLEYGAVTKYAPNNWKYVQEKSTYVDAILRHWVRYIGGEELDKETGQSHLASIGCNILFLIHDRQEKAEVPFEDYIEELLNYSDYVEEVSMEKKEMWGSNVNTIRES